MPHHASLASCESGLAELKRHGCLAGLICDECRNLHDIRFQKVEACVAEYASAQVLNVLSAQHVNDVTALAWSTRNLFECALIYHWVCSRVQPLVELDGWLAKDELDVLDSLDNLRKKATPGYVPDQEIVDRRQSVEARIKQAKKGTPKYLRIEELVKDPKVNRKDEYDAKFKVLSKLTHCSPYSMFERRSDNWGAPARLLLEWATVYSLEIVCRLGLSARSSWINQDQAKTELKSRSIL